MIKRVLAQANSPSSRRIAALLGSRIFENVMVLAIVAAMKMVWAKSAYCLNLKD